MKQLITGLILIGCAAAVRGGYVDVERLAPQRKAESGKPVASVGELDANDRAYLAAFFARVAALVEDRGQELLKTNRDLATLVDRCGQCVPLGRFSEVKQLGDMVAAPFEKFDGSDRALAPADLAQVAAGFRELSANFSDE